MSKLFTIVAALFILAVVNPVKAAECVDVDIELTSEALVDSAQNAAEIIHGSIELINCGDESDLIQLTVTVDLGFGPAVTLGAFFFPLGAGETATREFRLAAPPVPEEVTLEICITATSGSASSTACASVTFGGGPSGTGTIDKLTFTMAASGSSDCVDLDFEVTDTITTTPGDFFATGHYELINCGDTAALIFLQTSIDLLPNTAPISAFSVRLGAGESVTREFTFPIPPAVPEGDYTFTVTATSGDASVSVTEVVTVIDSSPGGVQGTVNTGDKKLRTSNYPNPFNPSTTISYELPQASNVSVRIYNILGAEVKSLVDDFKSAGEYNVFWDGTDNSGSNVSSGMYFYRITTDKQAIAKKMLLIK